MIRKKLYSLVLVSSLLEAGNFYNTMSMQGATGVINTPTAEVIESGLVELQFSNQVDLNRLRDDRGHYSADQYFLNFGLLPNLEVIGRLANIEDDDKVYRRYGGKAILRDLSASFKYQIPFYHDSLPKIAIGIQDIGGQASAYDSKYIVATKEYSFLRGSIGYGFDSINLLDGAFGSLEVKATEWATLLAEYDSKDTQVGLRLNTPSNLSKYVDVAFLAKANLDDDSQKYSFGLNIRMELGDKHHDNRVYHSQNETEHSVPVHTADYKTKALKEKLVEIGLENIDIKEGGESLYLAYENNIFEHNELDALGVVLGAMVALDVPYENFDIVIKRSNQKVKKVSGSLSIYKKVIHDFSDASLQDFRDTIQVSAPNSIDGENLTVENANSSYLKTRLRLYPGLITYVGTEYGTFDYLVSLRTAFHWNLYKGWDLGVLADFPAIASDDLDRDTGAYKSANKGNQLKSIMIHRSDVFGNFINVASAGLFRDYWVAFENLTYAQGNHTLGVKYAYFRKDEVIIPGNIAYEPFTEERYIYVANYTYYHDRWDTLLEVTAGKFFNDDRGFELKAKRYFGDTAVGFFYQNADEDYIGISIEVPLTPRKMEDSYFQVKGKADYQYYLRTTVNDPDNANYLAPGGLLKASREFDIEPNFLNKNRLNSDYVKKHVLRLRDAYVKYVVGE